MADIDAYCTAFRLSNYVWKIVLEFDYYTKDTLGKQWVRAVDSCSANVAEGFDRYTKADKVRFYRYTYGSIRESMDWTQKALVRKLIQRNVHGHIMGELKRLMKETNQLIKYTNKVLSK